MVNWISSENWVKLDCQSDIPGASEAFKCSIIEDLNKGKMPKEKQNKYSEAQPLASKEMS